MPLPELRLIERLRRTAGRALPATLVRGIGDDCAVLRLGSRYDTLVTTDLCLEGVHFRREWSSAAEIGHRCLTRGLSDVAAMGGEPVAAFLSLALPARLPQRWVDAFFRGFLGLARRHRVALAGGDIAASPSGVLADVVVLGRVPTGRALLRSGARPGDTLYVTGTLGGAAARVATQRAGKRAGFAAESAPRLAVGRKLLGLASAMIDTSDGLSTDLQHICDESGVGAIVYAPALPAVAGIDFALHGGEDYELLFSAPANRRVPSRIAGVPVSRIGELTRARKMWLADGRGRMLRLRPQGWQHLG